MEFERGDTIYETLDELRGHQGEVLHDFKLTVKTNDEISRPRASVSFESDYVGLSCNGPAQELPFRQAIDFLKARRRWMAKVPDSLWFFMGLVFPPAGFVLIYAALFYAGYVPSRFFVWVLFGVYIVVSAAVSGRVKIHRNLIFLKKRHEHAGFFRRNESHIVKAGIGLIFGILGYVIRMLPLGRYATIVALFMALEMALWTCAESAGPTDHQTPQ